MDILVSMFFPKLMKQFDTNDEVSCAKHGWIFPSHDLENRAR